MHGPVDQPRVGAGRRVEVRVADADDLGSAGGQAIEHAQRDEIAEVDDQIAVEQRLGGLVGKVAAVGLPAVGVGDEPHGGRARCPAVVVELAACRCGHGCLLGRWTIWTVDRRPARSMVAMVGPALDSGMVGLPGFTSSVSPTRLTMRDVARAGEDDVDIGSEEVRRRHEGGKIGRHADEGAAGADEEWSLVHAQAIRGGIDRAAHREHRRELAEPVERAERRHVAAVQDQVAAGERVEHSARADRSRPA